MLLEIAEGCYRMVANTESDPFDDENGNGYKPLERWGDRIYDLREHRWTDESCSA